MFFNRRLAPAQQYAQVRLPVQALSAPPGSGGRIPRTAPGRGHTTCAAALTDRPESTLHKKRAGHRHDRIFEPSNGDTRSEPPD